MEAYLHFNAEGLLFPKAVHRRWLLAIVNNVCTGSVLQLSMWRNCVPHIISEESTVRRSVFQNEAVMLSARSLPYGVE